MKANTAPRSDQYNADDFMGGTSRTFTIANVTEGTAEGARHDIHLEGEKRVWRPPVTTLRIMEEAWGSETDDWIGKRVTLRRDADVQFGREKVGGIRISHMSHLPRNQRMTLPSTITKGRKTLVTVEPLPDAPPPQPAGQKQLTAESIITAFAKINVNVTQLETRVGTTHDQWTAEQIAELAALGKSIKAGETTPYEEFEQESAQGELGQDGAE